MKKLILLTAAASALMLASCDPDVDDIGTPSGTVVSESELDAGFSVTQYSDADCTTESSTGNYFKYSTSPSTIVEIYKLSSDSVKTTMASGSTSGVFNYTVARGSDPEVTYYVATQGFDGSTISISRSATITVPSALTSDMLLLVSNSYGYKVWTWDTEFNSNGYVWGNAGYTAGTDGAWSGGIWWGATCDDDTDTGLVGQLGHSDTGSATGEELSDAYMYFYEDNSNMVETYDGSGNLIRSSSTLTMTGYDGTYNQAGVDGTANWCLGTLSTDAGSILFPFQINGGGTTVGDFEVMELTVGKLQLIYAAEGTGNWSECTWWAFKSTSDAEGELTDFATKTWKWDTEFNSNGYVWGNAGYTAGTDGAWSGGIWWGATCDDDTDTGLVGQLGHSDTGEATGEELSDAYMVFSYSGSTIASYDGSGNLLRSGTFSIEDWGMGDYTQAGVDGTENYAMGTLSTSSAAILFPFQINGGGTTVTDFAIVYLDEDQMQLVYAPEGTGNWGECTWWAFRAEDAFGSTSSDSDTSTDSDSGTTDDDTTSDSGTTDDDTTTDSGSAEEGTTDSGSGSTDEDGSGSSEE